jgi:hypothetical protein
MRRSLGDVGSLKRLWNLRMTRTSLGLTRRDETLDKMIARRHYIVEQLHPCVDKFATERDQIHWRKYNKRNFSMAKVRTTITPVRPCVTFHDLAERTKEPRERLRVQSRHLEPRKV